jgi:two-component system cell cycle sensor histidine kinase/response regulator CckA
MMKLGARDYLAKDASFMEKLPNTVARVLRELDVEDRLVEVERISREAQERLRLVLEGSQDGFWDMDLSQGTWFLSDRGWAILAAKPDSFPLTGDSLLTRLHPEDQAIALESVKSHLAGNVPSIELMVRVRGGEDPWKWVLLRGRAVSTDQEGRILRLAGTLGDATERKRSEENELRDRKMESLGLMAGGIAHDFNNLFQTLMSNLELMGPRFAGDARGRATLDRCFGILEKASALSRRMLDYSGGSLRSEEIFDLGPLVRQEAASLAHQFHSLNPGMEMVCSIDDGLAPTAGDPGLLAQVLQTLVHNGAEALHGAPGRLHVSLSAWHPAEHPLDTGGWIGDAQLVPALCLEVRDSGSGIPADHLTRIFDPFFSTKAHGRGLGLSASLGIIRSHGGKIHLESTLGQGTVFRVFLPFATTPGPQVQTQAPDGFMKQPGRLILLVDDEEELRASLAEILTDILDFRVIEARDGIEAVGRFQEHAGEVALVIMDVTMPRMSGIQAWEEIRKGAPAARGILCSGYSEETGVQLATGHGFLGFLKKPFNLQTLRETIRMALPESEA